MTSSCSDFSYTIYFTDIAKNQVNISKSELNVSISDIALIGKTYLEYGEIFNENLLHLLENFSSGSTQDQPNLQNTYGYLLERPVPGQLWFNKTSLSPSIFCGEPYLSWRKIYSKNSMSGLSGTILHGEMVPLPLQASSYNECYMHVSPFWFDNTHTIDRFNVSVNRQTGVVTALYTVGTVEFEGSANYLIFSLRGTRSTGLMQICDGIPPTPTPTATSTVTPTPPVTATPTITPSITPAVTRTPTQTPATSVTPSTTLTPTITPTSTPPETPAISLTPSATPSETPAATSSVTPTISLTPSETSPVTPTLTPTITLTPSETPLPTPEVTQSVTPEVTPTSSVTLTPSQTPAVTPTLTPTITLTPSQTPAVTPTQP